VGPRTASIKAFDRAINSFDGMPKGEGAQRSRYIIGEGMCTGRRGCVCATCRGELGFGSPWKGIAQTIGSQLGPKQILKAVQAKYGRVWEMTPERFVSAVKSGVGGIEFTERGANWVQGSLEQAAMWQRQSKGGIKAGFQEFTLAASGSLPERQFFAYNTTFGETVAVGSMQVGATGEMIRRQLVVAEAFRGKGLGAKISRQMFERGAIESVTLSTGGAKAYHKTVSMLAEEAGMKVAKPASRAAVRRMVHADLTRATMKTHAAQAYQTTPLLSSSVHGNRGSRFGRRGGNG